MKIIGNNIVSEKPANMEALDEFNQEYNAVINENANDTTSPTKWEQVCGWAADNIVVVVIAALIAGVLIGKKLR